MGRSKTHQHPLGVNNKPEQGTPTIIMISSRVLVVLVVAVLVVGLTGGYLLSQSVASPGKLDSDPPLSIQAATIVYNETEVCPYLDLMLVNVGANPVTSLTIYLVSPSQSSTYITPTSYIVLGSPIIKGAPRSVSIGSWEFEVNPSVIIGGACQDIPRYTVGVSYPLVVAATYADGSTTYTAGSASVSG